jgi:anti-sigma B factor antagonist
VPGQGLNSEREFEVRVVLDDGQAVVVLTGEIDLAALPEVRAGFADAFARGPAPVGVDLASVAYFGSDGIRALLEATHTASELGVPLRILAASEIVRRVLALTGADRLLRPP